MRGREDAVLWDVKKSLLLFITVYNRGAWPQVSGGCTGLFIFFIEVKCTCQMRDGCTIDGWEVGVLWDVKKSLLLFITVYNRGAWPQVSGGCTGLFIFFFIEVKCTCQMRDGCAIDGWEGGGCCAVRCEASVRCESWVCCEVDCYFYNIQ